MAARTLPVGPRMQGGGMLGLVLALLLLTPGSEGRRRAESCPGGRALGDKWFDGCQWCVCSVRGVLCSRSECSSLVRKVRPCHVVGQKWTDGCYRCRCKRHGIACRLDVTCLLLRHHSVPCLADDRCVCGPDGVPSCTAEVIDRHAFAARRVDMGIPSLLGAETRHDDPRMRSDGRHHGGKVMEASSMLDDMQHEQDFGSSSQELLITSDNLCRFGPRWYGGSLRCFCDIDGSITCGNPTFVSAFFDDFRVKREECEEGHVWEEGCSVCTCRVNGVVFCRHDRNCRRQYLRHGDNDDSFNNGIDRYLPGFVEPIHGELVAAKALQPSPTDTSRDKITARTSRAECIPGSRWKDGCKHCHCNDHARAVCSLRHCNKNAGKEKEDEEVKEPAKNSQDNEASEKPDHRQHYHHQHQRHHENDAKERPATMKPFVNRGPRGPMMMPPRPVSIFRPPAYSQHGVLNARKNPCGRFRVGAKYWDDCNLCLCTSKGPKCQGKLCR